MSVHGKQVRAGRVDTAQNKVCADVALVPTKVSQMIQGKRIPWSNGVAPT